MHPPHAPPPPEPVHSALDALGPKLLAGGISCMTISAILNPMDVVKVRLQNQNAASAVEATRNKLHLATPHDTPPPAHYRGFFHALSTIYKQEGYFKGLMRGFTPSMLREASYSSIRMGLYDAIKVTIAPQNTNKDQFTLFQKLVAGMGSGALGSVLATPTDLVKIRFQSFSPSNPNPYKSAFHAFADIYQHGGIGALYKGGGPTVLRAAILTGTQLSSYDHSKRLMIHSGYFDDDVGTHLLASIIAGLTATTCTNPVDVIKTRYMSDMCIVTKQHLYANPIDCFIKTIRSEGPLVLMRGWTPSYLRLGPHFIVSLPLAEFIRKSLGADSF